jgi:hypothetical protein
LLEFGISLPEIQHRGVDMAKKKITIFYSWQTDLPNATNRAFIERALEKAIGSLNTDAETTLEPCLDRDTLEVPGTPDIPATIFDKIDQCHVFVGDVSILNATATSGRKTPNPNVLLELGYAAKSLTWDNVICVFNKAYGDLKDLPFDLQRRRMSVYSVEKDQEQKAPERDRLASVLREALQAILKRIGEANEREAAKNILTPELAADRVHEWLTEDRHRVRLDQLVKSEVNKLARWIAGPELPVQATRVTEQDLKDRLQRYDDMSKVLVSIMTAGCRYGTEAHEKLWVEAIQGVANYSTDHSAFAGSTLLINMRRYPAFLLLYAGGIGAIAGSNYQTLLFLLSKPMIYELHGFRTVCDALHPSNVIEKDVFNKMLGGRQQFPTPLNDHVFQQLRDPLRIYLHDDLEYHLAFNRFEYMRALFEADRPDCDLYYWPAIGRFAWQWRTPLPDIRKEIDAEVTSQRGNWLPFQAGWFYGEVNRFQAAQRRVTEMVGKLGGL